MKNLTKGQVLFGVGSALLITGVVYFGFIKKYENGLTWYGGLTADKEVPPTVDPDSGVVPPLKPPAPLQNKYAGKRVSDVLLNTEDSKVKGLKVYAIADNVPVANTNLTPYTTAKKGQLLGTFSSSKLTSAGGVLVQIYTGKTPSYLLAGAVNLKF